MESAQEHLTLQHSQLKDFSSGLSQQVDQYVALNDMFIKQQEQNSKVYIHR